MILKKKKRYNLGDIVRTKLGNLAVVTEISGGEYCVNFIGEQESKSADHNAWHEAIELSFLANIYKVIEEEE